MQMLYQGPCRADCRITDKGSSKAKDGSCTDWGRGGGGAKGGGAHPFTAVSARLQPATMCNGKGIQGGSASCLFSRAQPAGRRSVVQIMLAVDRHQAILLVYQLGCEQSLSQARKHVIYMARLQQPMS